jgi:hypothetical protein
MRSDRTCHGALHPAHHALPSAAPNSPDLLYDCRTSNSLIGGRGVSYHRQRRHRIGARRSGVEPLKGRSTGWARSPRLAPPLPRREWWAAWRGGRNCCILHILHSIDESPYVRHFQLLRLCGRPQPLAIGFEFPDFPCEDSHIYTVNSPRVWSSLPSSVPHACWLLPVREAQQPSSLARFFLLCLDILLSN